MGRNEFYAWVDQASRELSEKRADDPGSWKGTEEDDWWIRAREKLRQAREGGSYSDRGA